MSKRIGVINNSDNKDITNLFNFDTLSIIFDYLCDYLPIITFYPSPCHGGDGDLYKRKILSPSKIVYLSSVCKKFRELIAGNCLFKIWRRLFMFNIGKELGIKKIDEIYDINTILLRLIVVNDNIIYKKWKYLDRYSHHFGYIRPYDEIKGLRFCKFYYEPKVVYDKFGKELNSINDEYNECVKNMKMYIDRFNLNIEKNRRENR
jgi:hypothetical protein